MIINKKHILMLVFVDVEILLDQTVHAKYCYH